MASMEPTGSLRAQRKLLRRWVRPCVGRVFGSGPVPLPLLLGLRQLTRGKDSLTALRSLVPCDGAALTDPFLARALASVKLGGWALDAASIDFLAEQIATARPSVVLEFGSGASTICMAHFLRNSCGESSGAHVFSFDHDPRFAAETRERLRRLGLEAYATVFDAPLAPQLVEGRELTSYDVPHDVRARILARGRAQLCLVDGPIVSLGSRFATLPLLRQVLAPGARFFLDDALRDGELDVARQWAGSGYLRVDGVHLFGKGMLEGVVTTNVTSGRAAGMA
jgi:hypothetical protein